MSMPILRIADVALQRLAALEPFPQPPIIRTRYPVVLMHGFGLLGAFRRGGHLHDEAMNLRSHGVLAYAPNVAPYHTVPIRAEMWRVRIQAILDETEAERVNLVAQSMGGLDARYLITTLEMHGSVASLTTVSTPHHGSPIAAFLLDQPERLQAWVTDLCNWMGTNALEGCTADFLTAVSELTHEYVCDQFNPSVPDHPEVRYWSYAGAAGKGTEVPINPFLIPFNNIIYAKEGINDGFVSTDSARWGTFLGTIGADHAREVGIQLVPGGTFRSNDFYCDVARMLSEEGL
jgi:triacylglycerol lipase